MFSSIKSKFRNKENVGERDLKGLCALREEKLLKYYVVVCASVEFALLSLRGAFFATWQSLRAKEIATVGCRLPPDDNQAIGF